MYVFSSLIYSVKEGESNDNFESRDAIPMCVLSPVPLDLCHGLGETWGKENSEEGADISAEE